MYVEISPPKVLWDWRLRDDGRGQSTVLLCFSTNISSWGQWSSHPIFTASFSLSTNDVMLYSVEGSPLSRYRQPFFALLLLFRSDGLTLGLVPCQRGPPDNFLHRVGSCGFVQNQQWLKRPAAKAFGRGWHRLRNCTGIGHVDAVHPASRTMLYLSARTFAHAEEPGIGSTAY